MSKQDIFLRASDVTLTYPRTNVQLSSILRSFWGSPGGFSRGEASTVLKGVNLYLQDGDRVGLTGSNGAGKTTFLKLLSGGIPPTSGRIEHRGHLTSLLAPSAGMNGEATGYENILLRGLYLGIPIAEMREQAAEIIQFAELEGAIQRPLRTYSAGMRARLSFAITMQSAPEILLLDEWLGAGDRSFQQKAAERMVDFVSKTRILIVASHNHALLSKMCNRIIRMENGRIISDE